MSVDHNAALAGEELEDIELHQLPLLEKSSFVRALVSWQGCCSIILSHGWCAVELVKLHQLPLLEQAPH